ncbi:hypothetical protein ACHAXT_001361 [Thalassiosira profunda]
MLSEWWSPDIANLPTALTEEEDGVRTYRQGRGKQATSYQAQKRPAQRELLPPSDWRAQTMKQHRAPTRKEEKGFWSFLWGAQQEEEARDEIEELERTDVGKAVIDAYIAAGRPIRTLETMTFDDASVVSKSGILTGRRYGDGSACKAARQQAREAAVAPEGVSWRDRINREEEAREAPEAIPEETALVKSVGWMGDAATSSTETDESEAKELEDTEIGLKATQSTLSFASAMNGLSKAVDSMVLQRTPSNTESAYSTGGLSGLDTPAILEEESMTVVTERPAKKKSALKKPRDDDTVYSIQTMKGSPFKTFQEFAKTQEEQRAADDIRALREEIRVAEATKERLENERMEKERQEKEKHRRDLQRRRERAKRERLEQLEREKEELRKEQERKAAKARAEREREAREAEAQVRREHARQEALRKEKERKARKAAAKAQAEAERLAREQERLEEQERKARAAEAIAQVERDMVARERRELCKRVQFAMDEREAHEALTEIERERQEEERAKMAEETARRMARLAETRRLQEEALARKQREEADRAAAEARAKERAMDAALDAEEMDEEEDDDDDFSVKTDRSSRSARSTSSISSLRSLSSKLSKRGSTSRAEKKQSASDRKDGRPPRHDRKFDYFQLVIGVSATDTMVRLPSSSELTFADLRTEIEEDVDLPWDHFKFSVEADGMGINKRQEKKWRVREYDLTKEGDGSYQKPWRVYVKEARKLRMMM